MTDLPNQLNRPAGRRQAADCSERHDRRISVRIAPAHPALAKVRPCRVFVSGLRYGWWSRGAFAVAQGKLDAVGLIVSDLGRSVRFYRLLGAPFPEGAED